MNTKSPKKPIFMSPVLSPDLATRVRGRSHSAKVTSALLSYQSEPRTGTQEKGKSGNGSVSRKKVTTKNLKTQLSNIEESCLQLEHFLFVDFYGKFAAKLLNR